MRYSASEKLEIIRLVDQTLAQCPQIETAVPGWIKWRHENGGKAFYAPGYQPGRGWDRDLGPMTREQAIAKAQEVWVGTTTSAAAFVKMLEVLGVTVEGIDGGGGSLSFASRYSSLGRAAARLDGLASRRP